MSKIIMFTAMLLAVLVTSARSQESYSEKEPSFRWGADELEFSLEPSFTDGFVVRILPVTAGPELFVHRLHRKITDGSSFHALQPIERIVSRPLALSEFDGLVAAFESAEIRNESERSQIGPDGSVWTFRKQVGGRRVTLRFWSPHPSSRGRQLGMAFLRAARLDPDKFLNERPNKAPEPTPTAVTSPAAQEPRQP